MATEVITRVECPHCQTAFRALPEHAGKRAKCSHCGGTIVVPGEPMKPPPPPAPAPDQPQYVGVNCLLCGTRMYGTLADVGKELKCPDCGRLTKLPPPEVKKKRIPAAMEGEQYELWEGDNQPWGVALSAAGPQYVAVECRLCQTHLQATIDQVGKKIRCSDCGAETVVRIPATGAKAKAPPPPPVDEYGVEDAVATAPLTSFYLSTVEEAKNVKADDGTEIPPRDPKRSEPLDDQFAPRRELPRWPMLSDNFAFLWTPGVLIRMFVMTGTSFILGTAVAAVIASGNSLVAVVTMPLLISLSLVWFAALSAASSAVITDSAAGNDEVHDWPSSGFMDWIPDLVRLIFALVCSAFPGWCIAYLSPELTRISLLPMGVSVFFFFPVIYLSQLAEDSFWSLASPNIILSWFRCPLSWLGFYFQSFAIFAALVGVALAGATISKGILLIIPPLFVVGYFYYFRIMGRLAWVIAETAPFLEEDEKKAES